MNPVATVRPLLLLITLTAASAAGGQQQAVPLTLIGSAIADGAVCLDGTPPAYHFDPGFGSGANNWLVDLEGGGWCNNRRTCAFRKTTRHGSSDHMEKQIPFNGILSNDPQQNPDFYNWNRVRVRYCDGASFSSEGVDLSSGLFYRGQRIWSAAMAELMSKGMRNADKALLSGCSAGGLSVILHCDGFRAIFPATTTVKCFADAGLFLNALDVVNGHSLWNFFNGVVTLQGVAQNLPQTCTSRMDATSCFFPQNLLSDLQTPTFLLNSAYDVWQIQESLASRKADPGGLWDGCKHNFSACSPTQLQFLQGFRNQMVSVVQKFFSESTGRGAFINSCFAHCQSGLPATWYADGSPSLHNKRIATSVGDWYFDRAPVEEIDCPFPCDKTCQNIVFGSNQWMQ